MQLIDSAPKDGSPIGVWSPKQPRVVNIVRWGHHLGNAKTAPCWVTATRGIAVGNLPTHWLDLGPLPDGVKGGSDAQA